MFCHSMMCTNTNLGGSGDMFLASEDCSVAVCAFLLPNAFASDLRKLRRLGPGWTGGGDICDQVREIFCEATDTFILLTAAFPLTSVTIFLTGGLCIWPCESGDICTNIHQIKNGHMIVSMVTTNLLFPQDPSFGCREERNGIKTVATQILHSQASVQLFIARCADNQLGNEAG